MGLLNSIPPSKKKVKGWPLTIETDPAIYNSKFEYPKISIVTPTYNQGQFIEETIRSILLQNYPNLQYIIIDGGSTDNTIEIIKKYDNWIDYWVSEEDEGQSDAINKGLKIAQGQVINWINSDDFLMPNALFNIATEFINNKDAHYVIGDVLIVDEFSKFVSKKKTKFIDPDRIFRFDLSGKNYIPQPAGFFSSEIYQKFGIDSSLHFAMDCDLWIKMGEAKLPFTQIDENITSFRVHSNAKSFAGSMPFILEIFKKYRRTPFNKIKYYSELTSYIIKYELLFGWNFFLLKNISYFLESGIKYPILFTKYLYRFFLKIWIDSKSKRDK